MTNKLTKLEEEILADFEEMFYRNENRAWISRAKDMEVWWVPEMERAELFRFFRSALHKQRAAIIEMMKESRENSPFSFHDERLIYKRAIDDLLQLLGRNND